MAADDPVRTITIDIQGENETEAAFNGVISGLEHIQEVAANVATAVSSLPAAFSGLKGLRYSSKGLQNLTHDLNELSTVDGSTVYSVITSLSYLSSLSDVKAPTGITALVNSLKRLMEIDAASIDVTWVEPVVDALRRFETVDENAVPVKSINGIIRLVRVLSDPAIQNIDIDTLNSIIDALMRLQGIADGGSVNIKIIVSGEKAAASVQRVTDSIDGMKAKTDAANTSFGKLWSSIKRIALYRLIRTVLRAIAEAFKEGTKNAYDFAASLRRVEQQTQKTTIATRFADTMDSMATSTLYLKNALGALVVPLLNILIPALNMLIDGLVFVTNVINPLLAALSGSDSYMKAIKVQKQYSDAIKETKNTILGFDEINKLNGKQKALDIDTSEMFEVVQMTPALKTILQIVGYIGLALLAWKISDKVITFFTLILSSPWGKILVPILGIIIAVGALIDMFENGVNVANTLMVVLGSVLVAIGVFGLSLQSVLLGAVVGLLIAIVMTIVKHWDKIKEMLRSGQAWIVALIATISGAVLGGMIALALGLSAPIGMIVGAIVGAFAAIVTAIVVNADKIGAFFTDFWNGIVWLFTEGIPSALTAAGQAIGRIVTSIWHIITAPFVAIGKWFYNIGCEIINGIVNGIKSGWDWIKKTVTSLATSIVNWFKGLLGIHSPSTVAAKIGMQWDEGYIVGMLKGEAGIKKASARIAASIINAGNAASSYAMRGFPTGSIQNQAYYNASFDYSFPTRDFAAAVAEAMGGANANNSSPTIKVYIGNEEFTDFIAQANGTNLMRSGGFR